MHVLKCLCRHSRRSTHRRRNCTESGKMAISRPDQLAQRRHRRRLAPSSAGRLPRHSTRSAPGRQVGRAVPPAVYCTRWSSRIRNYYAAEREPTRRKSSVNESKRINNNLNPPLVYGDWTLPSGRLARFHSNCVDGQTKTRIANGLNPPPPNPNSRIQNDASAIGWQTCCVCHP